MGIIGITLSLYGSSAKCETVSPVNGDNATDTSLEARFWSAYKSAFFRKLPNGTISVVPYFSVKSPNSQKDQIPSEAMGHALVFAAQRNDWKAFNELLNGLSYFRKDSGVFRWRICADGTVAPGEDNLNSASETEQNVAYALLMAYEKTSNPTYKDKALELLKSIWQEEVIDYQGKKIIMPADLHNNQTDWPIKVDPSGDKHLYWYTAYSSPEHLRKFAEYDTAHDWPRVINDWYELMNNVLDMATAPGGRDCFRIAPDGINPIPHVIWLTARSGSTEMKVEPVPDWFVDALGSKYSDEGDSIRIPLYIGMDASNWQAKDFLTKFYKKMFDRGINLDYPEEAVCRLQNEEAKTRLMSIGAYAVGLKAIGRDVSQFAFALENGQNVMSMFNPGDSKGGYYNQTIWYYSYFLLKSPSSSDKLKAATNDHIIIRPNPYRPGSGRKVTFWNLPPNAEMKIYNIAGELVKKDTANYQGMYEWDGTNSDLRRISPGFYIVVASDDQGHMVKGRLGIGY